MKLVYSTSLVVTQGNWILLVWLVRWLVVGEVLLVGGVLLEYLVVGGVLLELLVVGGVLLEYLVVGGVLLEYLVVGGVHVLLE